MTLHPDEQAREFRIALSKELPVLTPYGEEIFDKALATLLARVRQQGQDDVLHELSEELADDLERGLIRRGLRAAAAQPGDKAAGGER